MKTQNHSQEVGDKESLSNKGVIPNVTYSPDKQIENIRLASYIKDITRKETLKEIENIIEINYR